MSAFRSSPSSPSPVPARRLRALVFVGALLPAAAMVALGAWSLAASRAQYDQRAELLTQNLSAALDHGLSANIEKIDLALSEVVDRLDKRLASGRALDLEDVEADLRFQDEHCPELGGLRVTDEQGWVVAGGEPGRRVSYADRDWFSVQRDHPDRGLMTSPPLQGRLFPDWIVSFSRRYQRADGSFAGAVTAAVPLSHFDHDLSSIDPGPHGVVALRDATLGLVARYPQPAGGTQPVGSRVVAAETRQLVEAGRTRASLVAHGGADGVLRMLSLRRLAGAPLYVIVGVAADDYLADWRAERRSVVAGGLAALLLYGLACTALMRLLAQNRRARGRIELLAKVFEHSGEALVITDAANRIVEVNPAFSRQTGYRADEVIGRDPHLLASERTPKSVYQAMWQGIERAGFWRGEIWDRAKDGHEYAKWMSLAVVRDEAGSVQHYIGSSIDMTELKRAEARILDLAQHDTLTRLPNRAQLHGRLEQAMASARREDQRLAMMFIDMDRFKTINDSLGHAVGDGLLVEVGERLRGLVRECDIVARLGGDEFVLVITGIADDGERVAASVAAKVVADLGRPYAVKGCVLHSTPSVGIALFPHDGEDADSLMKNADAAMYHAKSAGRNNYQFFTAEMNRAGARRLALDAGLRTAIERGELFLHYQPQLDLRHERTVAVEALVRWKHPELGAVAPLEFIPVAEESGQIEAIGAWVLESALAQLARWRAAGHVQLRVAVNLSAQQLRGEGLPERVAQALARHGLEGEALELEITESIAMRDPARTAALLRALREQGVALAIDDFGTGYSSLAYLKQLPLTRLKLDRSFVMDLEHDPNDAAICTATIQLAHGLGLAVVAEGVETAAQLGFLRRLDCDLVQGYHLSRPLGAAELAQFLERERVAEAA